MGVIRSNFTQILKAEMFRHGISQVDLADLMGIKVPVLNRKMKDKSFFTLEDMILISDILKFDFIFDTRKKEDGVYMIDCIDRDGETINQDALEQSRADRASAAAAKRETKKAEKENKMREALEEKGVTSDVIESVIADLNKTE